MGWGWIGEEGYCDFLGRGGGSGGGIGEGGVFVLQEAPEFRAGGLGQGEVLEAGDRPGLPVRAPTLDRDDGGAGLAAVANEGLVVRGAVDGDPIPEVLLDLDAGAGGCGDRGSRGGQLLLAMTIFLPLLCCAFVVSRSLAGASQTPLCSANMSDLLNDSD